MKLLFSLMILTFTSLFLGAKEKEIKLDRFEKEIKAFEKLDKDKAPPQNAVVITGSSSIRLWHPKIEKDLAPLTVIPRGFGGSTMAELLHYCDRIVSIYKPRAVVIYEGDNDTGQFGVPPEKIAGQMKEFIEKVHKGLPETRIYIISVKPSLARVSVWDKAKEVNRLYQEIAKDNDKVQFIDIATPLLKEDGTVMDDIFEKDNLHLNEKGTRIWAETIKNALKHELKYE